MSNNEEIYQKITDTVLKYLENPNTNVSWQKQWRHFAGNNHQSILGRTYKGVNQLLCGIQANNNDYKSKKWATFKQWNNMGHRIKKGESALSIIMFKKVNKTEIIKTDNNHKPIEEKKTYNLLKTYMVFNGSQIENYVEPEVTELKTMWEEQDFLMIDNRAKELGAKIVNREDQPYFSPLHDFINMPNKFQFEKPEHYYATFLHELTHWTDKEGRSPREKKISEILKNDGNRFYPDNYAFEELVAELGSAFLLSHYNLSSDEQMRIDHIPYIQSWIKQLKQNNKTIIKASAFAQKACDFITGETYVEKEYKPKEGELSNV